LVASQAEDRPSEWTKRNRRSVGLSVRSSVESMRNARFISFFVPHFVAYTSSLTLRRLHFVVYTSSSTLRRLHFVVYTSSSTLRRLHFVVYTSSPTLRRLHFVAYTSSSTLRRLHFVAYTSSSTLRRLHFVAYTSSIDCLQLPLHCRTHGRSSLSSGVTFYTSSNC